MKTIAHLLITAVCAILLFPYANQAQDDAKAELFVQTGHSSSVSSVAYSSDGKLLATGDSSNTIKIRDTATGFEVKTLRLTHIGMVHSLVFSPNSRLLVSADSNNRVMFWDIAKGEPNYMFTDQASRIAGGSTIAFSYDSKEFASVTREGGILIWNFLNEPDIIDDPNNRCYSIVYSRDGKYFACGGDKKLILWDALSKKRIKVFDNTIEYGSAVAISQNNKFLAGRFSDETIKIYDIESGTEVVSKRHQNIIGMSPIRFSNDNKYLAFGSLGSVVLWNLETNKTTDFESMMLQFYEAFDISPDSRTLTFSAMNELKLIDLKTQKTESLAKNSGQATYGIAVSHDGRFIAISGQMEYAMDMSMRTRIWDLKEEIKLSKFVNKSSAASFITFSPVRNLLAVDSWKNAVHLFDADTKTELYKLNGGEGTGDLATDSIAFSTDGKLLAAGNGDKKVRIWNLETGQQTSPLEDPTDPIKCKMPANVVGGFIMCHIKELRFSNDGKKLFGLSTSGTIVIWDLQSLEVQTIDTGMNPLGSFDVTSDGKTFASSSTENTVKLWASKTLTLIKSLELPVVWGQKYNVGQVKFLSDTTLACSTFNGITILDITTGRIITDLKQPNFPKFELKKTPNLIFSISGDGTIVIWDLNNYRELATLLAFNDEEWIVTTPEGRFDTNKNLDNFKDAVWTMPSDPITPVRIEAFMRHYYEPNLLARVMKCNKENTCDKEFKPLPPIGAINRMQPEAKIVTSDQRIPD